MLEYFPQIKLAHVSAVFASGALFLLRGLMVQAGRQDWALYAPVRILSYSIDSALLGAALMLLAILPGTTYANGWLVAKVTLLLVYILLGTFALKRARTQRKRLWCLGAAILTYGFMLTIAWTHNPLGLFSVWPGSAASSQNLAP